MMEEIRGNWTRIPVEHVAVKLDVDRRPIRMRIDFADGTRRVVDLGRGAAAPTDLVEILCDKAVSREDSAPCWWG